MYCSSKKTGLRYTKRLLLEESEHSGEAKHGHRRNQDKGIKQTIKTDKLCSQGACLRL